MAGESRDVSAHDLLRWSETLSAIARTGLGFTKSLYEQERFEEVLKVAADMRVAAGHELEAEPLVEEWLGAVGDGVAGYVTHLDVMWENPAYRRFCERLASFSRLILFDKRGMGLSDRVRIATLEERMDDVRAVLDAVGSERGDVVGGEAQVLRQHVVGVLTQPRHLLLRTFGHT